MTTYTKINDLEGKKLVEPEGQDSFYAKDTVQGIENDIQGLTNAIQENIQDLENKQAEKETNEATLSQRQEDLIGLRACGVISLAEKAEAEYEKGTNPKARANREKAMKNKEKAMKNKERAMKNREKAEMKREKAKSKKDKHKEKMEAEVMEEEGSN